MPLSIDERVQVILLAGSGRTHREIAGEFSRLHPDRKRISHATVGNLLAKFKETGAIYDRRYKNYDGCSIPEKPSTQSIQQNSTKVITSSSSDCGVSQPQKRYRYAVVDIKEKSSEELYDLLIDNGYNDFLLLDKLSDHPDFELSLEKGDETKSVPTVNCDSDLLRPASSTEIPTDVPYFKEVSAADLLGVASSDVDAGTDGDANQGPSSPLFENCPRQESMPRTSSKNGIDHRDRKRCRIPSESSVDDLSSETGTVDASKSKVGYPSPYVICQLCKKVIMASRFSNLSNHARRHSVIKKFKCVYCDLQHNEHTKIRGHMAHMHGDASSEAIDNTWRMKKVWEFLVQKCFPHYTPSVSADAQTPVSENDTLMVPTPGNVTFVCGICGYQEKDQWKVRWHITSRHAGVEFDGNIRTIYSESSLPAKIEQHKSVDVKGQFAGLSSQAQTPGRSKDSVLTEETPAVKTVTASGDELRNLLCKLCGRVIDGKGLTSVVMHAKAHYHVKQFECDRCGYGSNTRSLVRRHIYSQHRRGCTAVVEHNDDNIKNAWTQVIRACFPNLPKILENTRDKVENCDMEMELEM